MKIKYRKIILFAVIISTIFAFKSDKQAYQLFNSKGKKVSYEQMMKTLKDADVIFIGEFHNNPISHWFELEITFDLSDTMNPNLVLGAEMFEADNQLIMDEYLSGSISSKTYADEMRLWPNYATDYKPLVELAKQYHFPFIATNIPRRYAAMIYNNGFEGLDSLNNEAYRYIAPLPIEYNGELKCYKDMMAMGEGHGGDKLPKAQAIKDATMAYFISKNIEKGKKFIHYNGAYHSDNHQGIVWYLQKNNPDLKIATVTTTEQGNITKLDTAMYNQADFIIAVDSTMTKTY